MVKIVDEEDEDVAETMAKNIEVDDSEMGDIDEMNEDEPGVKISSITKQGKEIWPKRPAAPQRDNIQEKRVQQMQPRMPAPQNTTKIPDVDVEENVEENVPINPWSIKEVPVQTQQVFYNSETEETLDINLAIVRILNILENNSRALSG